MRERTIQIKKDKVKRLEPVIKEILENHGCLTAQSIKIILNEKLDKRITRKRVYRRLSKMKKWNKVKVATKRRTSFFKVVQDG